MPDLVPREYARTAGSVPDFRCVTDHRSTLTPTQPRHDKKQTILHAAKIIQAGHKSQQPVFLSTKKSEHHETKEKKSTNMIYVASHVPPWPLMPTNNGLNYISSRNCSLEFSDPSDACVSEDGGMAAWTLRLPATPTCVRTPRSEVDGQSQ